MNDHFQTEIIRSHGYDTQEHTVETRDGYILCLIRMRNLERMPKGNFGTFCIQVATQVVSNSLMMRVLIPHIYWCVELGLASVHTVRKMHWKPSSFCG